MCLSEFRGAKFVKNDEGYWEPDGHDPYSALYDLARSLHFESADDYLKALPVERENIFKRWDQPAPVVPAEVKA